MKFTPTSADEIAVYNACLSASRDPNIYVVYYTTNGKTVLNVWDKSDILSFNFSDEVCGDANMAYGGVGSKSFSFSFYKKGAKPTLESDSNKYHRFDVYYTPNDSVVKAGIVSAGGYAAYFSPKLGISVPSQYLIDLGTFFLENYRFQNNVGNVDMVDCIGFMRSANYVYDGGYSTDPKNPVIRYVMHEIETITGLHWIYFNFGDGSQMRNGNKLKLFNAADWNGSSCYDVLTQIAKSCGGFVKAVPGNSYSDIAFSIVYPGGYLNQAGIPTFPPYQTYINYDCVYSIKNARSSYSPGGAKYLGNGYVSGSGTLLEVDQNDVWDSYIWQWQSEANRQTQTQSLLADILIYCQLPGTRPYKATTVACPIYETLDVPGIAIDANGYAVGPITSLRMNNLGQMEVCYAGQIDAQQNYVTGSKTASTVRKNTSAINKLNTTVTEITDLIKVRSNSIGIGTPAATSNIPVNGRVDSDMDFHFNNRVYLGDNQLKYITHQSIVSSSQLSSAGWYRIASWSIGASTNANGSAGILVNVAVATQYQGSNNSLHKISLIGVYNKIAFIDETSTSNTNGITKIRYMTSASGNGAIDIYYSLNTANLVRVDLESYFAMAFVSEDFTPVGLSPQDENEAASYTFSDNAQSGIIVTTESVTTSSGGYVSFSSAYPPTQYFILSATTTKSDAFVRLTGSSSGQWIRVLAANGSAVASETITVKLAMLKLS